jgi:diketogulonate reductase-like aldo/keto reductase
LPVFAARPAKAGKPLPGVVAEVVDVQGNKLPPDKGGLLILRRPFPHMFRTVYGDPGRYAEDWGKVPHAYSTGDVAICDADGYFTVVGRADDVLNVAGHRIGTADVEGALAYQQPAPEALPSLGLFRLSSTIGSRACLHPSGYSQRRLRLSASVLSMSWSAIMLTATVNSTAFPHEREFLFLDEQTWPGAITIDRHWINRRAALAKLQQKGLVRHIGLSNVTAMQIAEARRITPIVCVQNMYNLVQRTDDALIDDLARDEIAYVPFFPLGGFSPLQSAALSDIATRLEATPMQVALAWLLQRSPNILLIPGTSSVKHLRENLKASTLELTSELVSRLDSIGRANNN